MTRRTALRRGRAVWLVVGVAALATGVALAAWRPWSPPATTAHAADAAGTTLAAAPPSPLTLPEEPRVLVFGDSWTYGSAAHDLTQGYAYVLAELLGGTTIVDGVRGSGYLRAGVDGPDYGTRIAELDRSLSPDLVIVQGSINDRLLVPQGYDDAVTAAWDALAEIYPRAQFVVLGPAPHELPVATGTAWIDKTLTRLAAARSWAYVSPLAEDWITTENYPSVIDTGEGRLHPTTQGHRYLAERLASDLDMLRAAPVTEAGRSEDTAER